VSPIPGEYDVGGLFPRFRKRGGGQGWETSTAPGFWEPAHLVYAGMRNSQWGVGKHLSGGGQTSPGKSLVPGGISACQPPPDLEPGSGRIRHGAGPFPGFQKSGGAEVGHRPSAPWAEIPRKYLSWCSGNPGPWAW